MVMSAPVPYDREALMKRLLLLLVLIALIVSGSALAPQGVLEPDKL